ncbi:MAG TPA: hypothetical protein PLP19_16535 [bacterium]|nr:hypothetical protein [bacterium]HPN45101.1 hypothetical protein [bacterium]
MKKTLRLSGSPVLYLSGRIETNLYPTTGFRVNHIIATTFRSWNKQSKNRALA